MGYSNGGYNNFVEMDLVGWRFNPPLNKAEKKLFIDDSAYADIDYIRAKVRAFKSEHPNLSMIILDSLKLKKR